MIFTKIKMRNVENKEKFKKWEEWNVIDKNNTIKKFQH